MSKYTTEIIINGEWQLCQQLTLKQIEKVQKLIEELEKEKEQ